MPRKRRVKVTPRQTTPEVSRPDPEQPSRPFSRGRAILFRLAAVSFPLFVLSITNVLLYWCGVGHDTRVMVPDRQAGDGQTFVFNEDSSLAYYDERELAGPDVQPFRVPRPPGVFRLVVLGASTVEGFPYYTELAFPRQVAIYLGQQLPDKQIEVLNAGIVGINSFALVDLLPRVLPSDPDLVVVYAGHNEFYGPGGVGSNATTISPDVYPLLTALRRWRLYQVLRRLARGDEPRQALITALPSDLAIRLDSPEFRQSVAYYREHLTEMVRAANKRRVPILLCAVASNLSAQSPVSSLAHDGLSEADRKKLNDLLQRARKHLDEGEPDIALQLVEEGATIDDQFALVSYRRAECLTALGKKDEAAIHFQLARDQDGCRFRAPGAFRKVVREVATTSEHPACYFLDVEEVLMERSEKAAPGHDFFLEHVHFNRHGHREVARAMAYTVLEDVLGGTWDPEREPSGEDMIQMIGLTTFDQLAAVGHALAITKIPPFNAAPDSEEHVAYLMDRLNAILSSLSAADQIAFAELDLEMRNTDMINTLAAAMLERGDVEDALRMFACAQQRRPWEITAYVGAAKCLLMLGDGLGARECLAQARKVAPHDEDLRQIAEVIETQLAPPLGQDRK